MGTLYTLRSGGTAHPEDSVLQLLTDIIVAGGVKNLSDSDHLQVVEKGVPDMSVDIKIGRAVIKSSSGNVYPVRHTTSVSNETITANASGNPRIDAVVIFVNIATSPNSDASNVLEFTVVAGTPAGSPSAPSDSDIQTAVGASNPFLRLADVAVSNGETSIEDSEITDQRIRWRTRNSAVLGTASDQATTTYDVSEENVIDHTLGGNRILELLGVTPGDSFIINLIQGGGGQTVTWWSGITWFGGVPVLTATAGRIDSFGFIPLTKTTFYGFVLGQDGQ